MKFYVYLNRRVFVMVVLDISFDAVTCLSSLVLRVALKLTFHLTLVLSCICIRIMDEV